MYPRRSLITLILTLMGIPQYRHPIFAQVLWRVDARKVVCALGRARLADLHIIELDVVAAPGRRPLFTHGDALGRDVDAGGVGVDDLLHEVVSCCDE